jgi:hypothetical protein
MSPPILPQGVLPDTVSERFSPSVDLLILMKGFFVLPGPGTTVVVSHSAAKIGYFGE